MFQLENKLTHFGINAEAETAGISTKPAGTSLLSKLHYLKISENKLSFYKSSVATMNRLKHTLQKFCGFQCFWIAQRTYYKLELSKHALTIMPTPADTCATARKPSDTFCVTAPLTTCTSDAKRFINSPVLVLSKNAISCATIEEKRFSRKFFVMRCPETHQK